MVTQLAIGLTDRQIEQVQVIRRSCSRTGDPVLLHNGTTQVECFYRDADGVSVWITIDAEGRIVQTP